jgi:CRISPR-associated protein Cmr5
MRKAIDALIPKAYDVLNDVGIANAGVIENAWRGQISAFGGAIQNGSLLAAVAVFSDKGNSSVQRPLLMKAIKQMLCLEEPLFEYIMEQTGVEEMRKAKQKIIEAAVALKLAMNLYEIKKVPAEEVSVI